jgi:hypothetical protein
MRRAWLVSEYSQSYGTFGKMITDSGFYCNSLELPWKGNKRKLSCIPALEYLCKIISSPHFGKVYQLQNVPGRSYILTHSINFGGDVELGLKTELEGCIGLGEHRGVMKGQKCLLVSRPAVRRFMEAMQFEPFYLSIIDSSERRNI